MRRGDPALDAAQAGRLRRRHRVDPGIRPGRGDRALRPAPRGRRPGPALLYAQPGGPHLDDLGAAGAVEATRVPGMVSATIRDTKNSGSRDLNTTSSPSVAVPRPSSSALADQ